MDPSPASQFSFHASLRANVTAAGAVAGHVRYCAWGNTTGIAGAGAGCTRADVALKQNGGR
eukprot:7331213-Prorocentrum_lima.AAC.1